MAYLETPQARARRLDPGSILPGCRSILVLGTPYTPPKRTSAGETGLLGHVAAYATGRDYHLELPSRMEALVAFIEAQVGRKIAHRVYTDTGPVLERELGQRAGLGWIGRNGCLINPQIGSYFLISEIFLDVDLEIDAPFSVERCGTCRRCLDACPTGCIQPDRTLDARSCISYLTIEHRGTIPADLRPRVGNHIFGCDICQQACPWNTRAPAGDAAFLPRPGMAAVELADELSLTPQEFNRKFTHSPIQRARWKGYLRSIAVALGNSKDPSIRPALEAALEHADELVAEHIRWALQEITW